MTQRINPEITEKIVNALASYLKRDPASITEEHHLRDDLGLDSVAVIELLFEIEERFKLQIPDQDLPGLSTVGSVAAYVQRRLDEPQDTAKSVSAKPSKTPAKSPSKPSAKPPSTKSAARKPASAKATSMKHTSVSAKKTKSVGSSASKAKKKVAAR